MPKVTFSLSVPPRLLDQFKAAAFKAHRLPSDVLIDFMRNYIREARESELPCRRDFSTAPLEIIEGRVVDFARASERLLSQRAAIRGEDLARSFLSGGAGPFDT